MDVFAFNDYKSLLKAAIESNKSERGYQAKCAESARCHQTYLSQVLNGNAHLTCDHGYGLAVLWKLSAQESDYFIDLILYERAASLPYKQFLRQRMDVALQTQRELGSRLESSRLSDLEKELAYFSNWWVSCIHLALTLTHCKSPTDIARRLDLPMNVVLEGLATLEKIGFAKVENDQWVVTNVGIHLPKNSPMCNVNHINWRNQSINRLGLPHQNQDLRYTAIHSMTMKEAEKFRTELLDTIVRTRRDLFVHDGSQQNHIVNYENSFVAQNLKLLLSLI